MNVTVARQLDAAVPVAVFVAEGAEAAIAQALPDALRSQFPLLADYAKADETALFHTPGASVWYYGVGNASKLAAEKLRKQMHGVVGRANGLKQPRVQVLLTGMGQSELLLSAVAEVAVLSNYQFLPYKTKDADKQRNKLMDIVIVTDVPNAEAIVTRAVQTAKAACVARDLVNEPPNVLTPTELADRAVAYGKEYGFSVEVFNKAKIESLKMGGLLAVNRGSQGEPRFSILEWKPADARNSKPVVLVGKGITFDTGGLSLKPTPGSMDSMKSDMAGAAAVVGAFISLAANKVPVHVIGLIPSTDNRPGEDAYTPNDVITMYDGSTVEVLNTDAEGRMILADALAFAKQYEPMLVIDLATLTGAAVIAVGTQATAFYNTADEKLGQHMLAAGFATHERLVQMPLWDEYGELLKSDIADMKNIGGRYAGSITAAKFLERFTAYPWMHLDIAGPAYLDGADSYRGKNGTGVGVRLLTEFLRTLPV